MPINPLGDRVLVKRQDAQTRTKGRIFIPETAKEKPVEGLVIAVGGKVESVKVADRVLFSKYGGTEVEQDGTPLLLLKEEDILATVTDAVCDVVGASPDHGYAEARV